MMSNEKGIEVTKDMVDAVQKLIEWCFHLYMRKMEVVTTLFHRANVEPIFTLIVWVLLEEDNPEFFRAYNIRLVVKDQILRFNKLLERQVELMYQMSQKGASFTPLSNGSQTHSNSLQQCMQVTDSMHGHPGMMGSPLCMPMPQNSPGQYMPMAQNSSGHAGIMYSTSYMPMDQNSDDHPGMMDYPPYMPMYHNSAGYPESMDSSLYMPMAQNSNSGFNDGTVSSEVVYVGECPGKPAFQIIDYY